MLPATRIKPLLPSSLISVFRSLRIPKNLSSHTPSLHSLRPSQIHLSRSYEFQHCFSNYFSLLQSIVRSRALRPGTQIHACLVVTGFGFDTILFTKLIDLYTSSDFISYAHYLFDRIPKNNVFLWNILIRAYAWKGPHETAISLYYQMLDHGVNPDNFTFPFVLKACAATSALAAGRDVHEHAAKSGWESDVFVGAGIIDMYAKCGCVQDARRVFDSILRRDSVLWNSLIAAYAQNGLPSEALSLLIDMVWNEFEPTIATLVITISAAADAADLPRGREIHGFSWRRGFSTEDKIKTAFVDMYAKSGLVSLARKLFEQLMEKKLVSWNAMICGYGMHGHTEKALELFSKMRGEKNVLPDHITFVGVLSACSHGGLIDEGWEIFNSMKNESSVKPNVQHYTCMVALLGQKRKLNEAYELIMEMAMTPDSGVWGALLNASKIHGHVEFGELALRKLIELEPGDAGNYVLLSNIYAHAGKWEEVARVRKMMTERGLKKAVACSWIEVKGRIHAFLVGDLSHPRSEEIYAELDRLEGLMKEAGYVPETMSVFHDVEDDEKRNMVRSHSERLAVAFGIISSPPGTRLLITKNLRICEDCHTAIKLISKIVERDIIVRDVNRYHHFGNGKCSCKDYW